TPERNGRLLRSASGQQQSGGFDRPSQQRERGPRGGQWHVPGGRRHLLASRCRRQYHGKEGGLASPVGRGRSPPLGGIDAVRLADLARVLVAMRTATLSTVSLVAMAMFSFDCFAVEKIDPGSPEAGTNCASLLIDDFEDGDLAPSAHQFGNWQCN